MAGGSSGSKKWRKLRVEAKKLKMAAKEAAGESNTGVIGSGHKERRKGKGQQESEKAAIKTTLMEVGSGSGVVGGKKRKKSYWKSGRVRRKGKQVATTAMKVEKPKELEKAAVMPTEVVKDGKDIKERAAKRKRESEKVVVPGGSGASEGDNKREKKHRRKSEKVVAVKV